MGMCKNCGAAFNGAKFCPECGMPANAAVSKPQMYAGVSMGADLRQHSLAEMEQMLNYFSPYKKVYDDFDRVSQEVAERSARSYGGWIGAAVVSIAIGLFSKAAFFYVAAAAFVGMFILLTMMNKKKLAAACLRQTDIYGRLEENYNNYGYCPVGLEYTNPETLQVLRELIRKGRANTPGDAINIHLADMEQAEMLRLQQEAAENSRQIAENTKQAAKQARKAANYASASFWFK